MQYPLAKPWINAQDRAAVHAVLLDGQITYASRARELEASLEDRFGRYALLCSSGTAALHLALCALNVGPGDEVIVPDVTFVASANAVKYVGATPVFVDVDLKTWNASIDAIRSAVTPRTRAIVAVHLYGNPMDCQALQDLSDELRVPVVEDAAQGLGGWFNGAALGTFGQLATFSFYGNKVVTTGEGGLVLCKDKAQAERVHLLRGQGMSAVRRYYHEDIGFNYRMTDLQAALGYSQFGRLHGTLQVRERLMLSYRQHLPMCTWQEVPAGGEQAPWLPTALVPEGVNRDSLAEDLLAHGIETRPVFVPMHQMPMYGDFDSNFPHSMEVARRGISFPLHVKMTETDVRWICDHVVAAIQMQLHASVTH